MKNKNVLSILIILMLLWPSSLNAADTASQAAQNAISVDLFLPIYSPVEFAGGNYLIPLSLLYQRVITRRVVFFSRAGLIYTFRDVDWGALATFATGVDWHPFHEGLNGFHLGFSGYYTYDTGYTESYRTVSATAGMWYLHHAALGSTIGWQFLLPANLTIDLNAGIGYGYTGGVFRDGEFGSGWTWVLMPGGIFFGLRF
jgi:hypothetical protein